MSIGKGIASLIKKPPVKTAIIGAGVGAGVGVVGSNLFKRKEAEKAIRPETVYTIQPYPYPQPQPQPQPKPQPQQQPQQLQLVDMIKGKLLIGVCIVGIGFAIYKLIKKKK